MAIFTPERNGVGTLGGNFSLTQTKIGVILFFIRHGVTKMTGQAFNASKYSKNRHYTPSFQTDGTFNGLKCSEFKKKYHLTEKNLNRLMMNGKRLLIQNTCGGYRYEIRKGCEEEFKYYCMYERKNHPAKKGIGRMFVSFAECDEYNRVMYPFWF